MKHEARIMNKEKGQAPTPIEGQALLKGINFLKRMRLLLRSSMKKKSGEYHPQLVSGQVMLLTVMMLTGVILSTTSLVALITLYQIRQTGDVTASNQAIFAADAGIECALYKKIKEKKSDATINEECTGLVFDNKAQVKVVAEPSTIKSAGKSRRSSRAFEVSF